jgi:hypothetical protein
MHDDPEGVIGRQLSRPTDDKFLCILVEIPFAKWKRIEAMKKLGDFFNPNLDRICGCRWLFTHGCLDWTKASRKPIQRIAG